MSDPKSVEVLRKARELIAKPGGWTRNAIARDSGGFLVVPYSPDAICFCAHGAIERVLGIPRPPDGPMNAHEVIRMTAGPSSVVTWNDAPGRTQAEVIAAFDRAIALAEAS